MSTGYTSIIENSKEPIPFPQFALQCARAFGYLMDMRDESFDTPIPEKLKPSPYHMKELKKAKVELARIESLTDAQCEKESKKELAKELKYAEEYLAEHERTTKRYEDMVSKINDWTPPTPEHQPLKRFMLEQIATSLPDLDYARKSLQEAKAKKSNGIIWRERKIKELKEDIVYNTEHHNKEVAQYDECNRWIDQLRKSLLQKVKP